MKVIFETTDYFLFAFLDIFLKKRLKEA